MGYMTSQKSSTLIHRYILGQLIKGDGRGIEDQSQGNCKTRFRNNLIIILQWEHIFKATDAVQQKSPHGALCPSRQVKVIVQIPCSSSIRHKYRFSGGTNICFRILRTLTILPFLLHLDRNDDKRDIDQLSYRI